MAEEKEVKKKKSKLKLILIILAAVIFLASVGVAVGLLVFGLGGEREIRGPETHEPRYETVPMEFTVNLSELRRFAKFTMVIAHDTRGLDNEIEERAAIIRNEVISILRTRTAEDLRSAEGLEDLRQELIISFSEILQRGDVWDIYFIDFLIQ